MILSCECGAISVCEDASVRDTLTTTATGGESRVAAIQIVPEGSRTRVW